MQAYPLPALFLARFLVELPLIAAANIPAAGEHGMSPAAACAAAAAAAAAAASPTCMKGLVTGPSLLNQYSARRRPDWLLLACFLSLRFWW